MASPVPLYPWENWFRSKTPTVLVRGKDYHCQPHGIASQIRNKAKLWGLVGMYTLHIRDDTVTLTMLQPMKRRS